MKSRRFGILSAAVLIVGALVLTVFRWPLASEVVYPVERLVRLVVRPIRIHLKGLFSGVSVAAENDRLQRELRALSVVRGDLERLRIENARLRRVIDYGARQPETWIAAEVLSRGGGTAAVRDVICVDKGLLAGVKVGAIVVVPEGLVGRVADVSPHTSEIALLTDSSVKVSCEMESSTGSIYGILSGGEPDGLRLRHLERAERVQPHSRVMTSGLGGFFPRGLEVGTLNNLVTNGVHGVEGGVLPCVDYSRLEDVFIRRDQ